EEVLEPGLPQSPVGRELSEHELLGVVGGCTFTCTFSCDITGDCSFTCVGTSRVPLTFSRCFLKLGQGYS
ncbi:MAG: hypothetical protein ACJ8BW_19835, partial [Ktedonobacteraceae bacterium]